MYIHKYINLIYFTSEAHGLSFSLLSGNIQTRPSKEPSHHLQFIFTAFTEHREVCESREREATSECLLKALDKTTLQIWYHFPNFTNQGAKKQRNLGQSDSNNQALFTTIWYLHQSPGVATNKYVNKILMTRLQLPTEDDSSYCSNCRF